MILIFFFQNVLNLMHISEMPLKNPEKVFCFSDKDFSNCCVNFSMFRRKYLSSVVNVRTNGVKISDATIADFVQLNIPQIHEKIG